MNSLALLDVYLVYKLIGTVIICAYTEELLSSNITSHRTLERRGMPE